MIQNRLYCTSAHATPRRGALIEFTFLVGAGGDDVRRRREAADVAEEGEGAVDGDVDADGALQGVVHDVAQAHRLPLHDGRQPRAAALRRRRRRLVLEERQARAQLQQRLHARPAASAPPPAAAAASRTTRTPAAAVDLDGAILAS